MTITQLRQRSLTLIALVLSFAGCSSGGHTGLAPDAANGSQTQGLISVPFTLAIPSSSSSSSQKRSPAYISSSIQSITITTTVGSSTPSPTQTVNCSGSCQTTLMLPVGPVTIAVVAYDQKNALGNQLSSGSTTTTIVANKGNAIAVTFNPVIGSIVITQSATTNSTNNFFAGYKGSVSLYLNVKDPDGNTIIGPGNYINANGVAAPITITNNDTTGHTSLSASTFSAPTNSSPYSNTVTMSYDGTPLSLFSPTVSVATAALPNPTTYTVTIQPAVVAIWSIPNSALSISSIAVGTDGLVYATVFSGQTSAGVIRLNPTTSVFGSVQPTEFANSEPSYLTPSPTPGGFWFYEQERNMFGHVRLSDGTVDQEIPIGTDPAGDQLSADGMATGADGNAWAWVDFYRTSQTASYVPAFARIVNGALQFFPVSQTGVSYQGYNIGALASTSSGKMAAIVYSSSQQRIGTISTTGTGYSDVVIPSPSGLLLEYIGSGSDGNFYIAGGPLYSVSPATGVATDICPSFNVDSSLRALPALPGNRFFGISGIIMYAYTVGSTTSCYSSDIASGVGSLTGIAGEVYAADGYIYGYGANSQIYRIAF